jgi:hypothetical protein
MHVDRICRSPVTLLKRLGKISYFSNGQAPPLALCSSEKSRMEYLIVHLVNFILVISFNKIITKLLNGQSEGIRPFLKY